MRDSVIEQKIYVVWNVTTDSGMSFREQDMLFFLSSPDIDSAVKMKGYCEGKCPDEEVEIHECNVIGDRIL